MLSVVVAAACSPEDEDETSDTAAVSAPTATAPATASPTIGSTTDPPPVVDTAPPTTGGEPPPASSAAFEAIDPIVSAYVAQRGLNGAGLVVVDRDAGVVHEDYWGVFGPDRVSLVASSSKMIVAGVLLALDEAGTLDLDAPVADIVDWGDAHPEVTPVQLVSNSSGLPGLVDGLAIAPYLCQFLPFGSLQGCAETIFTTSADDGRVIPPDTDFRYGGAQWQVAGAVAEAASGRPWNDLVADTYRTCDVGSLGFDNQWTRFGSIDFAYPDEVDGDPASLPPTENPNIEGGAYISPRDYADLLLMLLRDGRCGDEQVLSPESVDRMLADRIGEVYGGADGENPGRGYGLGWFIDRETGQRSDSGAYGSFPWLDPDLGYAAYLIIEATGDDGNELAGQLFDVVETAVVDNRNTVDG